MKAKIAEIFKSTQGEGIYQGLEQVFIRFFGCNLKCKFCDTPLATYSEFGSSDLMDKITEYGQNYHSVSLTGGEPLLQHEFLKEILPLIRQKGLKTYLETNGILHQELSGVIQDIDIVAMDFKLPSSTGMPVFWPEHEKFLRIALKKEVFVKIVVLNSTREREVHRSISLIRSFNKDIPLVFQPEFSEMKQQELISKIQNYKNLAGQYLNNVSILLQQHKLEGIK
ncbi:MAG: 7-carboxy-7-deazaguanine synthase QueE [Candidatus Omnitrophica bacterium]|nr:7-carboxy-7-deazaguanine synthase QueE [Candidatus Omnitrophota bacterium]MDD5236246.1 7-carboxy-7-deazaguanine synthase QueE [Candidatus Omnitrophota bacterium]MDD5611032.1 7-carboxy-7-deazaguanine synthase QueE [Candidatus Omnitrophota bacterium]